MTVYRVGPRTAVQQVPASNVNAGDVVVIGSLTLISDVDNPPGSGLSIRQSALYIGGVYLCVADAAYGVGVYVYWNPTLQQVSATYVPGLTVPFGEIVGGPTELASDGGPTGAGITCLVHHNPLLDMVTLNQASQALAFPRNLIDGGDFGTNPWQRASTALFSAGVLASAISNTVTYGPDRWFAVGGASSSILFTQVTDTSLVGFNQACKVSRSSGNANTAAFNFGQVLESGDCIKLQGQPVTFSFWAKKGANYSGGALTVALNHSITAGNDTAAHLVAASTNWQSPPTIINTTQVLTTGWVRYQFTGTVPTGATQLGLLFTWTPSGAAGADDSISFQGIQLEQGLGASPFEHRDIELELALAQRYYFVLPEANGANIAVGTPTGSNTQGYSIWLPTPMRVAPTVTVTVGGIKAIVDGGAAAAATGLTAGSAHSTTIISLASTVTLTAAAHSILLQGSGTTGRIEASAEF
jgi:predicted RecA/RadA family phage recombinase